MKKSLFQYFQIILNSVSELKGYFSFYLVIFIVTITKVSLNASNNRDIQKLPVSSEVKSSMGSVLGTPVYATWIMVWVGSTEPWFNPDVYNGATMWVNNTWKATNWNDNAQVNEFVQNMKNAGIKIIICDLTNGFNWMSKVKYIQGLCAQNGMQVCVAANYKGNFVTLDTQAKSIYDNLAGPNAPNNTAYFQKDGKPIIVSYCSKLQFDAAQIYSSVTRDYFNLVWSSGEDSQPDKWGWQLDPKVGTVPSTDAMFVTSSIKWASSVTPGLWRKSLAWLDYNFLIARKNNPQYIIVGSYDDIHERNGWLIANTTGSDPGMQFRDKFGAISTDAYYNRVKEWTSGANISSIPSGLILDGCYNIRNKKSNLALQMRSGNGVAGSLLEQSSTAVYPMNQYFWFYHLGNNTYRIIPLTTGLPLAPVEASLLSNIKIEQNWDLDVDYQKWILEQTSTGIYALKNKLSGKYLDVYPAGTGSTVSGASIIQATKTSLDFQLWKLEPIVQLVSEVTEIKGISDQNDSQPYIYLIDRNIIIDNLKGITELFVYNVVGQLINYNHSTTESIQIDNKEKGLILIVLKLENGTRVFKKLFVK
ncbi:MAG: RICIN domain-containing protein [Paludibacter sp.]|nr:RICIN domain-containing protein [Paludibacter sp.]